MAEPQRLSELHPRPEPGRKAYVRIDYGTARSAAYRLKRFGIAEFADELDISRGSARNWIIALHEGEVVQVAKEGKPTIFELKPIVAQHVPRRKEPPPEAEYVDRGNYTSPHGGPKHRGSKRSRPKVRDRELDGLVATAWKAEGWKVLLSKGHVRFVDPDGKPIFAGTTASDHRANKNLRATLKRHGLPLDDA